MWRLMVVVAACSGVPRDPVAARSHAGADKLVDATRAFDAAAIEAMFAEPLVFGGMWFPDPACRQQFAAAGTIKPEARAQLAKCMSSLQLAKSHREHAYPEIAILTYDPGLEIEAQLGPRGPVGSTEVEIRWIGHVSRSSAADELPTITQRTLESLHEGPLVIDDVARGKLDGLLAEIKAKPNHESVESVSSWVKLCLDAEGRVTSIEPRTITSGPVFDVFAAVARTWTFRPQLLANEPAAVCSVLFLAHPVDNPAARIPAIALAIPESHRKSLLLEPASHRPIVGTRLITPDDDDKLEIMRSKIRQVMGVFVLCADGKGVVDHVDIARSTGIPRYDAKIVASIKAWRYAPIKHPDGSPATMCTQITFIYSQN